MEPPKSTPLLEGIFQRANLKNTPTRVYPKGLMDRMLHERVKNIKKRAKRHVRAKGKQG